MRTITQTASLLLLLSCTPACLGTDVGNPIVNIDLPMYNESFPDQTSTARAAPGTAQRALGELIAIDDAWVAIDRIRLRSAADCSGGAEVEIEGPLAVDLLEPGPPPELRAIDIPQIGYCRFELRWHAFDGALPDAAPPQLANAALYIAGARGDGTRFALRSDRGDELRLEATNGSFAVDETTHALFVAFDGARLFDGVDLDAGAIGGDGIIHIEDGVNEGLLDAFENNLDAATRLFDDDDGDGDLDSDERDPDDTLAD